MREGGPDDDSDRVSGRANVSEFDCGWVCEQGSGVHAPFIATEPMLRIPFKSVSRSFAHGQECKGYVRATATTRSPLNMMVAHEWMGTREAERQQSPQTFTAPPRDTRSGHLPPISHALPSPGAPL